MDKFKLVFRVPAEHVERCKTAVFKVGAGQNGPYTECCFSSPGTGQFRPGNMAKPHLGTVGKLEQVSEIRIETLCVGKDTVKEAVKALKE